MSVVYAHREYGEEFKHAWYCILLNGTSPSLYFRLFKKKVTLSVEQVLKNKLEIFCTFKLTLKLPLFS